MKIAFLMDKAQTFQALAAVLFEASLRGHDCVVYSTCKRPELQCIDGFENVVWRQFDDRQGVRASFLSERKRHDAVLGINLFNSIWSSIYEGAPANTYAVEYCWNEIYNCRKIVSDATLFANSDWSLQAIRRLSGYDNVMSIGSPWFDLISTFKSIDNSEYIVFMAPHNSFYSRYSNFKHVVEQFLKYLDMYCHESGLQLILKTREKYTVDHAEGAKFQAVLSDENPFDHLMLYAHAACVVNFCSSAINELAFLDVPSVCVFPELHRVLHQGERPQPGIELINERYYAGPAVDGVHCSAVLSDGFSFESVSDSIETVLSSKKDWSSYQAMHFPGDHSSARKNVMDVIEDGSCTQ